ncbi:MAG: DUF2244 domain-containing protein [Gammaproteobacteria bacterium]|nr:DUF2244 domain-containing protein [Gammaproteobacteria bacterium]
MNTRSMPDLDLRNSQCVWVRPNRSLSLRGMILLFAMVTVVIITIGVGFFLLGAWLVLPFAGLEIAVIGAVLYWLLRHADDHELIVIGATQVTVIRRRRGQEWRDDFQRYWVKVILERHHGWYPSKLKMGSHGRLVVIGDELCDEAKLALLAQLNSALRETNAAARNE